MNEQLANALLEEVLKRGVTEFCVCPGARNVPLVYALANSKALTPYYWFEERSAAFFALGRSRATGRPVAVVTTSGTAAGELLPATMEAHYTGTPLLLITADRPRRFRGTGAPQTAEQVGLFGCYAHFERDIAYGDSCSLAGWSGLGPAHLNVCFEEPKDPGLGSTQFPELKPSEAFAVHLPTDFENSFEAFISSVQKPLVVVSALEASHREAAVQFLLRLGAPVYAEGISGIREEARLQHLRVYNADRLWQLAARAGYPIDGILRIGGVPTARLWRDLEDKVDSVKVCSVSEQPFSGLSWAGLIHVSLAHFFHGARVANFKAKGFEAWLEEERLFAEALAQLFDEEPRAETSLVRALSTTIAAGSRVYLGNSLPIREWDMAATRQPRHYAMGASRGLNGIDGQLSTFLGWATPQQDNWAIVGDLTALYDLAAPWILSQLPSIRANIAIINNGGGKIFDRMFAHPAIQNRHDTSFESFAALWKMDYERWEQVPEAPINTSQRPRLIEIIPENTATARFWKKYEKERLLARSTRLFGTAHGLGSLWL